MPAGPIQQHRHLAATVLLADLPQDRVEVDRTGSATRHEDPVPGLDVDRPEDRTLRVIPLDRHLGRLPPEEPPRPQRRIQEQVGFVLEQLGAPGWQVPDLLPEYTQPPPHSWRP